MILRADELERDRQIGDIGVADDEASGAPCIYCGGTQSANLFAGVRDRLDFVDGEWSFERCLKCGAALLSPRPHSAELGQFYPPVYTFAPQVAQQSPFRRLLAELEYRGLYRPMYRSQARQIERLCGGGSGKRLLDIGCGRGLRLVETRRSGFEVAGMDFDPAAIDYLQQTHGVSAVACDVLELRHHFAAESFDAITAYYVVEHVVEVPRLLRDVFALLRPGGWLVAAVPLIDGYQAKCFGKSWCQVREAPRHVSIPTSAAMHTALSAAGFVDIHSESDSYLLSASSIALSMIARGTTNAAYAGSIASGICNRVLAIGAAAVSLPLAVLEGAIAHKPSLGVFAARRPA